MKVYVISLDRTPARWADFRALNKELSATRFSAVDGLTQSVSEIVRFFEPDLRYSTGALGCAASHFRLWEHVAQGHVPVAVLEDDAVAHQDLELLVHRLRAETLPRDWDYLALGYNMDCPVQVELLPGVTPAQLSFLAADVAANFKNFKALELRPAAYRLQLCFGTPGYVITPAGARKLLALLLPLKNFTLAWDGKNIENVGVDVALNSVYAQVNAYASVPPLVITPNDKATSTVQAA